MMMTDGAALTQNNKGFTLVEMLIAIVLASIIFVSAYQIISNLVQYKVRAGSANIVRQDEMLTVNLLSQIIEKSLSQYDLLFHSNQSVVFSGEADVLQAISRAYSENFDAPGYRVYRVFERNGELVIGYQKYDQNYPLNSRREISSGLELKQIRFDYLEDGRWVSQWRNPKQFPALIRTTVERENASPLVFVRATTKR